ncbi:MAG: hypothetical protein AB7M05_20065 [Alphaproteobacteria bacterium]
MNAVKQPQRRDARGSCGVSLAVVSPDAVIVRTSGTVWLGWGLREQDLAPLQHQSAASEEREPELCARQGDAAIVRVQLFEGAPVVVTARKGMTACHEIFYSQPTPGLLLIAEHYRNIVTELPPDRRGPTAEAVDYFLFRTVPAPATMCAAVRRLGRGERLAFERVRRAPEPGKPGDQADRLDGALAQAIEPLRQASGVQTSSRAASIPRLFSHTSRQASPPSTTPCPTTNGRSSATTPTLPHAAWEYRWPRRVCGGRGLRRSRRLFMPPTINASQAFHSGMAKQRELIFGQ